MGNKEKQRKYDDYIENVDSMAAAIGRRVPYHLTYLKEYGDVVSKESSRENEENN